MKNFSDKYMWKIISGIAIFSVIFFIVVGFVYPGWAVEVGYKDDDGELITKRLLWVQYLMNFLYFTFISNFIVMVISIIRVTNKQSKAINIWMIIGAISITMTMLVYWTVLFYPDNLNTVELVNTVLVHLIVPLAYLMGFAWDIKNKVYTIQLRTIKTVKTTMLFPFIWFIMSLILYYSLGGKIDHAIYGFLHHNGFPIYMSFMFVLGISVAFASFSFGFVRWYKLSLK